MPDQNPTASSPTAVTPGSESQPVTLQTPQELYGIFCGDVNLNNMHRLTNNLTQATNMNVSRLHILFHTWGGIVGDGVYLYNVLQNFPLEVVFYNAGQISSIGAIAYLGAKKRRTTANAIFMVHRSHSSPQAASATKLKHISDSLGLDDDRTEKILRKHLNLPSEMWTQLDQHDVFISGTDAVKYGLADEVAEFAPPVGARIFNALA